MGKGPSWPYIPLSPTPVSLTHPMQVGVLSPYVYESLDQFLPIHLRPECLPYLGHKEQPSVCHVTLSVALGCLSSGFKDASICKCLVLACVSPITPSPSTTVLTSGPRWGFAYQALLDVTIRTYLPVSTAPTTGGALPWPAGGRRLLAGCRGGPRGPGGCSNIWGHLQRVPCPTGHPK